MDRNKKKETENRPRGVALRKESVDRNKKKETENRPRGVALRKESVDRNIMYLLTASAFLMSLSARRAWIEIGAPTTQADKHAVALRKESVDRNTSWTSIGRPKR